MTEEFEAGKWKIYPKKDLDKDLDESYIELVFRLKNNSNQIRGLDKNSLQELKQDLQNLGKWEKFKELKKDLED